MNATMLTHVPGTVPSDAELEQAERQLLEAKEAVELLRMNLDARGVARKPFRALGVGHHEGASTGARLRGPRRPSRRRPG
jgi:hypothetical protein